MTAPDALLTLEEAASYLACPEEDVRSFVRHGLLRAATVDGQLRFHPGDLAAYLRAWAPSASHLPASPDPGPALARLSLLHTLLAELAATTEGALAAEQVVAYGTRAVQAQSGAVARRTDDGREVEIIASAGFAPGVLARWSRLALDSPLPLPEVVRTGSARFFAGPEQFLAHYPHLAGVLTQRGAWAFAPLAVGERVIGGLVLSFAAPRPFPPADQLLLAVVAQVCAQALERSRLALVEREAQAITAATVREITRAHERTQHLQRVTAALSEAQTPAQVAAVIVREGLAVTGLDAGAVYALVEDGAALEALADAGYPEPLGPRHRRASATRPSPLSAAVHARDVVAVGSPGELVARWPHLAAAQAQSGDQATLAVPLLAEGQVLGVMYLAARAPRSFSAEDLRLAGTIGQLCGQALRRASLLVAEQGARRAAEAAQARSRLLAELSQALAAALPDLSAVVGQVLLQLGAQFADAGALHLLADDGQAIRAAGAFHRDPAAQAMLAELREPSLPLDNRVIGEVIASGRPLVLLELDSQPPGLWSAPEMRSFLARFPISSLLIVPLRARSRVLGALTVARAGADRRFTQEDLQLLVDLADRAALAIDNAQLYASLQAARAAAEATAERIGRLQRLTAALADALTPEEVARVVFEGGTAVLGAQAGMLALLTGDGATLELVGATGYHEDYTRPWQHFPLDAPLPASDAARTGQLVLTSSLDELMARYPHLADRRWVEFQSRAAIPLLTDQSPQGSLLLSFVGVRRFSAEEQDLMLLIGRQCGQALQRARLYAREQQARAEAEAAVRVRDQFLSIAAHELKTPLTPLLGQAQLVERRARGAGQLGERDLRALQVIASQAQRLDQLVSSMLDLNRLQMGRLSLRRAPLDLRELVRRLADELAPTLSHHYLELSLPHEPALVEGDELRLEQVLQNLLQNAVRYSPEGGPVAVAVALRGEEVVLWVRDHGIGISAEALPRLFEPFFRAANAEERVLSGMGVGLAVVREIVTLHGGRVAVESVEGQGSTFTLALPRRHPPDGERETP